MDTMERVLNRMMEDNITDAGDIFDAAGENPGATAIATGTLVVAFLVFPLPFALLGLMHASASASRGIKEGQRQTT